MAVCKGAIEAWGLSIMLPVVLLQTTLEGMTPQSMLTGHIWLAGLLEVLGE